MSKGNGKLIDGFVSDLERIKSLADRCISQLRQQPKVALGRNSFDPDAHVRPTQLDFDAHIRAFVKKHARRFAGPQKFVLLLAYISKGRAGTEVPLNAVEQQWNKMTSSSLLGGQFNRWGVSM